MRFPFTGINIMVVTSILGIALATMSNINSEKATLDYSPTHVVIEPIEVPEDFCEPNQDYPCDCIPDGEAKAECEYYTQQSKNLEECYKRYTND